MIEVKSLHKEFGKVIAVDDVSFTAQDGAVLGLLGPNGAGKTTTLRTLCGLIVPDRGAAFVDGKNAATETLEAQQRIGALPDARGLYPRLTAREHVRYFGELHGLRGAKLEERCQAMLDLLEMGSVADRRVEGFSNGERTKVALARALVHDPQNVLLDEPTNGLDVMSTRAVRSLVQKLRAQGRCVVFSSHVMQEVAALCDRIVVIAKGRVAAEGTTAEIRARAGTESLEDAFVRLIGLEDHPAQGGAL
ncbi:MAG: ATP-binding cassette domain-containing protein [Deltaproteobacteria bacterium]|nr:ATP-binding cassette domain-containing protein [Deltaproteobacteria bacterium]